MKSESNLSKQMAAYGVVFSALVVFPGICIGLGNYLTKRYAWPDGVFLIFVFVGMVGAFLQIYRYFRWVDHEGNENAQSQSESDTVPRRRPGEPD